MPGLSRLNRCASLQALGAGALLPLAFSPLDWWPLEFVSIAWCYLLLRDAIPRQALRRGLCYGLGAFGVGTSWVYVSIHDFGNAPPLLASIITAGFVLVLATLLALSLWVWRRWIHAPAWRLPGFAAAWVLGEALRGWLFTGFPWLYLGYAHVNTVFSGIAPLFGVLGLSFFVALSGAALAELALRAYTTRSLQSTFRSRLAASLAGLWLLAAASTPLSWTTPRDVAPLRVGLVQGNIEQSLKFSDDHLQESLDRYADLSLPLWRNDLVVWPETAIPLIYQRVPALVDQLQAQADASHTTLISGIFFEDGNAVHNSLVVFGEGAGVWHKQKLVPFGEYVPLRDMLASLLQLFALPMSSLTPGPSEQEPLYAGPYRIAPFICYEVVYPDFVRRYGRDTDLLLTVSNDTWFGASWGPHQHLQMASMRARELGRYLVRATNNGISALVDERGHILARTPQFEAVTLEGEVRLFSGWTPFARWGSWPVLLLCLLILAANCFSMAASRQRASP